MYSKNIDKILKSEKIEIGDRIKITKNELIVDGILLPRIQMGNTSCIVIKQDNGYNIGIMYEKGIKLKLQKKGKPIELRHHSSNTKSNVNKPTLSILGAGGTISSRIEYNTGAVFPELYPEDLLNSFPQLRKISNIKCRELFNLFSEDITPEHWKIIAKNVVKEINSGSDGIIIMHGTDTMNYTATALSFMLQNIPVPIVLVGAQRSSDRGSSDNMMNLICAANTAAKSNIGEISVCMHGTSSDNFCYIHRGNKVRKMHTSRRDAFRSINSFPFAKVWFDNNKIEYLHNDYKKIGNKKIKIDDKINPNVGLLQIHPGINPKLIEYSKKIFDGVVISGTGLGHVSTNPSKNKLSNNIIPAIKNLIDSDIPVVMSPQTIYGRINMNVYSAGRLLQKAGVIGDGADWLPETALIKLMWVLGHTKNMKKIEEIMMTNISGEISKRNDIGTFLV